MLNSLNRNSRPTEREHGYRVDRKLYKVNGNGR